MAIFSSIDLRAALERRRWIPAVALGTALLSACGQEGFVTSTSTGAGGQTSASSTTGTGTGTGAGGSAPPQGEPLVIVNWNTHNFFDTQGVIGTDAQSSADYSKKRQAVGTTLKMLAPDIAILPEIETKAVLDDLNTTELDGIYTTASLIDTKDIREIALLSKIAPDKVVSHAMDTFVETGTNGPTYTYTRDCVEVHFTHRGKKLILLGVHFRSKFAPDNPEKRLAEAQHTRAIADALATEEPDAAIAVLGDYNDVPGSPAYEAVRGKAPALFTDAADKVPESARYSFTYQGQKQLIDHQMANPIMAAMLDPTSVELKHGKGIDEGSPYASDHAPLLAVYRFP